MSQTKLKITNFSKCECEAVTLYTNQGEYSVRRENLGKYFPDFCLDKNTKHLEMAVSYCCNHCVNHYGLDICACGSGEPFNNCDGETEHCGKPMQKIGEYERVIANDAWC